MVLLFAAATIRHAAPNTSDNNLSETLLEIFPEASLNQRIRNVV
jgi:hypothetical protein